MNKLKLFIENFLVYGLGGVISKIVPLIMVPIVLSLKECTIYQRCQKEQDEVSTPIKN